MMPGLEHVSQFSHSNNSRNQRNRAQFQILCYARARDYFWKKEMLRPILIHFAFACSFLSLALANGGPIDGSVLRSCGKIHLIQNAEIELLKEDLSFRIDGDFVNVTAVYRFFNQGRKQKVTIGFSALLEFTNEGYAYPGREMSFDSNVVFGFAVLDAGDTLADSVIVSGPELPRYGDSLQCWRFFTIEFGPGESKVLTISYSASAWFTDWYSPSSFLPGASPRTFRYDLSPAGFWGDGRIDTLNISVDAGLQGEIANSLKISGSYFLTGTGGKFEGHYLDQELGEQGIIGLEYDNSDEVLAKFIEERKLDHEYYEVISSSSELGSRSSPRNMFDGSGSTWWSEGVNGSGAGEWAEVKFTRDIYVGAIFVVNGMMESAESFAANGKVLKLRVTDIPLRRNVYTFDREVTVPTAGYQPTNGGLLSETAELLLNLGEEGQALNGIRFTILESEAGLKSDDTCISEIYILGWVPE